MRAAQSRVKLAPSYAAKARTPCAFLPLSPNESYQEARTTSNLATYHLWRPRRCIRGQTTRKSSDTTTVLLAHQPSWRRFFEQHWPSPTRCGGNLSAETVTEIRLLPLDLSAYGFASLESRNTCVVACQVLKCLIYHPNHQSKDTAQLPLLLFLKVVSDSDV